MEVAVPGGTRFELFEIDGTRAWTNTIQDNSGIAGVSAYDVDADGIYEVLYADEVSLRVFDGATGTVLYTNTDHSSGTLWEYPVVADVDGDGSAEIVIGSNGSVWRGITVLGHAGDGWAKSGPTWAVHDFAMTNLDADGRGPAPHRSRGTSTTCSGPVRPSTTRRGPLGRDRRCLLLGLHRREAALVAVQVGNPGASRRRRVRASRCTGSTEPPRR